MKTTYLLAASAAAALAAFPAAAQDHDHGAHTAAPTPAPTPSPAPAPDHSQHQDHMGHAPDASAEPAPAAPEHAGHKMTMSGGSGTARVPVADGGMPGVHFNAGGWMLMAHDRAEGDAFPMTHELLSMMLGVRRPGVTIAAGMLQKAGLIRYGQGRMAVADRRGLEAVAGILLVLAAVWTVLG